MAASVQVAEFLERSSYNQIEGDMLAMDYRLPGAATLAPSTVDQTTMRVAGQTLDRSFGRQMQQITSGELLAGIPDAFFVTANSAIPIADAITGFYDQAGLRAPAIISHVAANKQTADKFWDDGTFSEDDKAEIDRLRALADGRSACIVDQFSYTGSSIGYGAQLLIEAGADSVVAVRGRWYEDARLEDLDPIATTSVHKPFMDLMGRLAHLALDD